MKSRKWEMEKPFGAAFGFAGRVVVAGLV